MPSIPPLDDLMAAEREIKKCMTVPVLSRAINNINLKSDYWNDWCRVLASHKAIKLNDEQACNELLSNAKFEGYRYFIKS